MAVTVRITETYDMKTTKDKIGLVGIHTPGTGQIRAMYPGLVKNYKFLRVLKCDVVGACASVLPADPLQVGVADGDVAPEDMFNPILYKAVSNESFETVVNKIYGQTDLGNMSSINSGQITPPAGLDDFEIYYGLLASKGWKKAMPQRGFSMRGLYPICHHVLSTYGQMYSPGVSDTVETEARNIRITANSLASAQNDTGVITVFKGKSTKMPKIPMHYNVETTDAPSSFNIPKTFIGVLITPPARLHEFYYRMRVTWTVRFETLVSTQEFGSGTTYANAGINSYHKAWTDPSAKLLESDVKLEHQNDTIDAMDVSINKIMES